MPPPAWLQGARVAAPLHQRLALQLSLAPAVGGEEGSLGAAEGPLEVQLLDDLRGTGLDSMDEWWDRFLERGDAFVPLERGMEMQAYAQALHRRAVQLESVGDLHAASSTYRRLLVVCCSLERPEECSYLHHRLGSALSRLAAATAAQETNQTSAPPTAEHRALTSAPEAASAGAVPTDNRDPRRQTSASQQTQHQRLPSFKADRQRAGACKDGGGGAMKALISLEAAYRVLSLSSTRAGEDLFTSRDPSWARQCGTENESEAEAEAQFWAPGTSVSRHPSTREAPGLVWGGMGAARGLMAEALQHHQQQARMSEAGLATPAGSVVGYTNLGLLLAGQGAVAERASLACHQLALSAAIQLACQPLATVLSGARLLEHPRKSSPCCACVPCLQRHLGQAQGSAFPALACLERIASEAQRCKDDYAEAQAMFALGCAETTVGDYPKVEKSFLVALKIANRLKLSTFAELARLHVGMARASLAT